MVTTEEKKMKEDKLDLLLEWGEPASTSESKGEKGDQIDLSSGLNFDDNNTAGMEIRLLPDDESIKAEVEKNEEEGTPSNSGEIPDEFQWSEDLNAAIEEALGYANNLQMPIIHSQLNNVIRGLETGLLDHSKAILLTDEVEIYIHKHLKCRETKPPVNHEGFETSRRHIIDGLHAYLTSVDIIRKYIETGSADYINMAQSFLEQGTEFFLKATELMLESEPSVEN